MSQDKKRFKDAKKLIIDTLSTLKHDERYLLLNDLPFCEVCGRKLLANRKCKCDSVEGE